LKDRWRTTLKFRRPNSANFKAIKQKKYVPLSLIQLQDTTHQDVKQRLKVVHDKFMTLDETGLSKLTAEEREFAKADKK